MYFEVRFTRCGCRTSTGQGVHRVACLHPLGRGEIYLPACTSGQEEALERWGAFRQATGGRLIIFVLG
jgi:hypothetical protein